MTKSELLKYIDSMLTQRSDGNIGLLRVRQYVEDNMKTGKWIRDGHHIRCDQCGMYMCDTDREGDRIQTEFCPNCGVEMKGEEE